MYSLIPPALAGALDFAIGSLIGALLLELQQIKLEGPRLVAYLFLCSVLALLPDFDIVYPILHGQGWGDHHQTFMHTPAKLLPVVAVAMICLFGLYGLWERRERSFRVFARYGCFGATLGILCVTWHYIHDSPEFGGSGIMWAWPASPEYWTLTGVVYHEPYTQLASTGGAMLSSAGPRFGSPTPIALRELLGHTAALAVTVAIVSPRSPQWWALWGFIITGVWLSAAILWST